MGPAKNTCVFYYKKLTLGWWKGSFIFLHWNDMALRTPSVVHLWPPVQGSEREEVIEEGSRLWLQELLGLDRSRAGDGLSHLTLHIICHLGNMSGSCT